MSLDERENLAVEHSDVASASSSGENTSIVETSFQQDLIENEKETTKTASSSNGECSDSTATDDESNVEQKELTVTNLKAIFERLSQLTPDAKDKPNWWIRQNSKGEYILYTSSSSKPSGQKAYRRLSNPEKFFAHIKTEQIRVIDERGDKITTFRRNTASNSNNNDNDNVDISNQTDDKTVERYVLIIYI